VRQFTVMAAISENKKDEDKNVKATRFENIGDWKRIVKALPKYGLTIAFTGIRASGKTHTAQHFVHHLSTVGNRKYTAAFLFSATARTQDSAYPYIPLTHKFTSLGPLSRVLEQQSKLCKHNKEIEKEEGSNRHMIRSSVLVIIDDFSAMPGVRNDPAFTALYTHGRHLSHKLSNSFLDIVTLAQDITQLSPIQRSNCDLIASAQTLSYRATKLMAEDYLTVGLNRKEAYRLLHSLRSTPYLFLLCWVTFQPKTSLSSYCHYMLADKALPDFRIGGPAQWKYEEK